MAHFNGYTDLNKGVAAIANDFGQLYRPQIKNAEVSFTFLISQSKHMLWVLKRTVSRSTQNERFDLWIRKNHTLFSENFVYFDL